MNGMTAIGINRDIMVTVYIVTLSLSLSLRFPGGSVVKNPPTNAGDTRDLGLVPGLGRSPGEGNGNPLQYSCQEKPMDRGPWQATVHGVSKSQTLPND